MSAWHRFTLTTILLTAATCVLSASQVDAAINVDGVLSDWGVTVGNDNQTRYQMQGNKTAQQLGGANIKGTSGSLFYNIEDQNDKNNDGFLGPQYGGQNYDAEFLGVILDGGKLSIGILTGQRYDNGQSYFAPGDVLIVTSVGDFWVEVGGSGSGADGGLIELGENGSTFRLDGHGFTQSVESSTSIFAGAVLHDPLVVNAPNFIVPPQPVQIDPNTPVGDIVGTVDEFAYRFYSTPGQTQHAGIELSLDAAALFGAGAVIESVEWRPSCGNDEVMWVGIDTVVTPEPATLLVWGGLAAIGAIGAVRARRRPTSRATHEAAAS